MGYLLMGVVLLAASIGGLWASLPGADGKVKPFVAAGFDPWIAVALTFAGTLAIGAIVFGALQLTASP